MIIHWRQRRSRSASADRGIFFWSRLPVGNGGAVVIRAAVGLTGGKKKKRWYTFPNGIRVHATDEAIARQIANWNPEEPDASVEPRKQGRDARKAAPAPVIAPDGRDAQARLARAEMREAEKALAEAKARHEQEQAALAAQVAAELAEMERRDEEDLIAIMMLAA